MASSTNNSDQEPTAKRQKRFLGSPDRVTLDVGGEKFVAAASTLTSSSAYFASLLSDNWIESNNEGGEMALFLDQDPNAFRKLLAYMRRGMIKIEDIDIDVMILAEFLGMEQLLLAMKIRWYCNIGRGPAVSGRDDGYIAATFDGEYGGIMDAISSGLFSCFKTKDNAHHAEKELSEMTTNVRRSDDDGIEAISWVVDEGINCENTIRIACESMIGAVNGLCANGYNSPEKQLFRVDSVTMHNSNTLSRTKHSDVHSNATKIFIPSDDEAEALQHSNYIQLACLAKRYGEDGNFVLAPAEFSGDERIRSNPYAIVTIENAPDNWMQKNGFITRDKEKEECMSSLMNLSDDGEYETVRLFKRELPFRSKDH